MLVGVSLNVHWVGEAFVNPGASEGTVPNWAKTPVALAPVKLSMTILAPAWLAPIATPRTPTKSNPKPREIKVPFISNSSYFLSIKGYSTTFSLPAQRTQRHKSPPPTMHVTCHWVSAGSEYTTIWAADRKKIRNTAAIRGLGSRSRPEKRACGKEYAGARVNSL